MRLVEESVRTWNCYSAFTFKITGNHRGDDDKDSAKRRRLEEKGVRCVAGK